MASTRQTSIWESAQRGRWDELQGVIGRATIDNGQAASQTNPTTEGDGYAHCPGDGNDDDDEDDLPSIEDIIRNVKPKRARSCNCNPTEPTHHRAPEEHPNSMLPNRENGAWRPPQQRRGVRASSPAAATADLVRQGIVDLTADAEYCASCPNVLGQGNGKAARIFVVETCCCVVCGERLLRRDTPITTTKFRCYRKNHSFIGRQKVRELFAVDCQICWERLVDRASTPCGHVFCRSCIASLTHIHECPTCRSALPEDGAQFRSFKPVQYRVLRIPVPAPGGNCHGGLGCDTARPSATLDGDSSAAQVLSGEGRVGFAGRGPPQLSAMSHEVASLAGPSEVTDTSSDRQRNLDANASANAPRTKKRRRRDAFRADAEYFPSTSEQRNRLHGRMT